MQTISFSPSSGKIFFNEFFIPAIGEGFLLEKDFPFIGSCQLETSFLLVKTVTDMSGNHFLNTDLICGSGNSFSS